MQQNLANPPLTSFVAGRRTHSAPGHRRGGSSDLELLASSGDRGRPLVAAVEELAEGMARGQQRSGPTACALPVAGHGCGSELLGPWSSLARAGHRGAHHGSHQSGGRRDVIPCPRGRSGPRPGAQAAEELPLAAAWEHEHLLPSVAAIGGLCGGRAGAGGLPSSGRRRGGGLRRGRGGGRRWAGVWDCSGAASSCACE